MSRQLVSSNTPGERLASFSRAVRFVDIRPANTLLHGEPVDSEMLVEVEVEVDAVISPGP
jgi:hypothetical protein